MEAQWLDQLQDGIEKGIAFLYKKASRAIYKQLLQNVSEANGLAKVSSQLPGSIFIGDIDTFSICKGNSFCISCSTSAAVCRNVLFVEILHAHEDSPNGIGNVSATVVGICNDISIIAQDMFAEELELSRMRWMELSEHDKVEAVSSFDGKRVHLYRISSTNLPHRFDRGTAADIVNKDLVWLMLEPFEYFKQTALQTTSSFQIVKGGPGCGKSEWIIEQITVTSAACRNCMCTPSNRLLHDLLDRLIKGSALAGLPVFVLGKKHRDLVLPSNINYIDLDRLSSGRDIASANMLLHSPRLLVMGTVKKIDDLRQALASEGQLRFANIFHDEYPRETLLDTFVISKVVTLDGKYFGIGDHNQCTKQVDSHMDFPFVSPEDVYGFDCSLILQASLWQRYLSALDRLKAAMSKKALGGSDALSAAVIAKVLMINKRAHPFLVDVFSEAFYSGEMKAGPDFVEDAFPFKNLHHRLIFIDAKTCPTRRATGPSCRNNHELIVTTQLCASLLSLGCRNKDIMVLSPYALQAAKVCFEDSSIAGITVAVSQGSQAAIVICSFAAYQEHSLSMQDQVINTAGTRAQSLALFIINAEHASRLPCHYGIRKLMRKCPCLDLVTFMMLMNQPSRSELLKQHVPVINVARSRGKRCHSSINAVF